MTINFALFKGGFFSESPICFSNLQKNIQITILSLKFKFVVYCFIAGKFKFKVQGSDLEYFFWRFEKHIALSEKKSPLVNILGIHEELFT